MFFNPKNGTARRRRTPPIVPVFLLLAFTALVGYFLAEQQIAAAESQRLRLLAGFGDRVRESVPNLIERVIKITAESSLIEQDLQGVQNLLEPRAEVLAPEDPRTRDLGPCGASGEKGNLHHEVAGSRVVLRYAACASAQAQIAADLDEPLDEVPPPRLSTAQTSPSNGYQPILVTAEIDLDALLEPVIIPGVFDAVVIADDEGRVLFRSGEPELQVSNVRSLFSTPESEDPEARAFGELSTRVEKKVGGITYRAFLQPISLRLPASGGESEGDPRRWVACGLVRYDRLLSSSLTASPLMLLIMMAIFPLGLVSWPFLKLLLISPRQRFSPRDLAGLVLATFLGVAFLTLLLCDLASLLHLQTEFDTQLRRLSEATRTKLYEEIFLAYDQMEKLEGQLESASHGNGEGQALIDKLCADIRDRDALDPLLPGGELSVDLEPYPFFHTLSWIDRQGVQRAKLPLHLQQSLRVDVNRRDYFECAYHRRYFTLKPEDGKGSLDLCIDSVISSTAGSDLAVLSKATRDLTEDSRSLRLACGNESASEDGLTTLPVVAMTTRFAAISFATLAEGFELAVVDESGRVMFHSDSRRNLTENFLEASGENSELEALLHSRRAGGVTLSYWGQRQRAFVEPLQGLPWSLVTFRGTQELRARNLEVLSDFLNPFLLYALLLAATAAFLTRVWPRINVRRLWPDTERLTGYRIVALSSPAVAALSSLLLAMAPPTVTLPILIAGPPLSLVASCLFLLQDRAFVRSFERRLSPALALCLRRMWRRGKSWQRFAIRFQASRGFDIVVLSLSCACGVFAFFHSHSWATGVLLAYVIFASLYWIARRGRFVGRQRRFAFAFALSATIFFFGMLPSLVIAHYAAERQQQFLLQDMQLDLATAAESQSDSLAAAKGQAPYGERFEQWLDELREHQLSAVNATRELHGDEALEDLGRSTGFLWPSGRTDGRGWKQALADTFSVRIVPMTLFTRDSRGVDLARFERRTGSWDRHGRLLHATLRQDLGGGPEIHLVSSFQNQGFFGGAVGLRLLVLGASALVVFVLPWLFGAFLSAKVFLVSLVGEDRFRDISELIDQATKKDRILVVTGVPDVALGAGHCMSFTRYMQNVREGKRMSDLESSAKEALVLTQFRPSLDSEDGGEAELRELRRLMKEKSRALILVSRMDPRAGIAERGGSSNLSPQQQFLARRWASLLGSFVVRYAVDSGQPRRLARALRILTRHLRDPARDPARIGPPRFRRLRSWEAHKKLHLLWRECRHTRQLQEVGLQLLASLEPPGLRHEKSETPRAFSANEPRAMFGTLETISREKLIGKIGTFARSYYVAIWEACTTNEKIALTQLAKDGLVNPQRFESLLDLMQKGLVVRDPSLRIFNRSFAQFVRQVVRSSEYLGWEEESGPSAWDVIKWILPLPILLLGAFLFYTQRDAFSNVAGLVIAFAAVAPTLINLFRYFQEMTLAEAAKKEPSEANG